MRTHTKTKRLAAALATASCMALASPVAAQVVTEADAQARYDQLAAQADERLGDPEFDYQLGIAALDTGRYGEAIIALQRVLAVQPDNAAARAELARAFALAGDIDTARNEFATVVDNPTLPDPVRQRFTGFVRQFDEQIRGGGSSVSGFVDARLGHDSNVNSATDLTTLTIPLFAFLGPGTLGAGAREQEDQFAEVTAGISAVEAVGRQDRVFGSLLGSARENFDVSAFSQESLTATAGYAHTFANRDVISVSAQAQVFALDWDGYRDSVGAVVQYTHLTGRGQALTLSGQYNRLNYPGQPLLDADRFAAAIGFVTQDLSASLQGGKEETRRVAGDHYSNWFMTASLGAELPLGDGFALVAGAAFDLRRYDAADPLFLVERSDERFDAQAGLKVSLTDQIFLQPRVTYTRNWSNIALYDYDRWTASAGLRFEF